MLSLGTWYQIAGTAAAVVAVLGGVVLGWRKVMQPRLHAAKTFVSRIDQTINGRPAEHDAYGRVTSPAIPALSDQHEATQRALANLADTVAEMHDERARIDGLETRTTAVEVRVTALEQARVEHIVGSVETAAAHIADRIIPDAHD